MTILSRFAANFGLPRCCVVVLLGLLAVVQPSRRLSNGPSVDPFGPHAWSGITPVLVAGSNAPCTAVGLVSVVGSVAMAMVKTPP